MDNRLVAKDFILLADTIVNFRRSVGENIYSTIFFIGKPDIVSRFERSVSDSCNGLADYNFF